MVAKVFGKVIQVRLQRVAEEMLPDSQCGFRAGRGCADMIFCARQLVEKAKSTATMAISRVRWQLGKNWSKLGSEEWKGQRRAKELEQLVHNFVYLYGAVLHL